ncbi:MAG TPA: 2-phospho-L-lactate transferase [Acidimicrobiales bacterium]|nr:2-phospho-L-lactate transferase [Acidimicrobiales bacterium]
MLVALAGGVGAARLLAGLVEVTDPAGLTAVINTADDLVLHGLSISPDIDTVTYTLAGLDNREQGWGVAGETWAVMDALEALGGPSWFRLGDRDLATHLYRSDRLAEGATLSEVTAELAARRGVTIALLPMSDDPVRTLVTIEAPGGAQEISFQDYFVRLRHDVAVRALRFAGAESAHPAPGVLDALADAELIICCPSNPLVSIGPILAVPGIEDLLTKRRPEVVAVSPIVGGAALRGPADRLLRELGHEPSARGVARLYAPWVGTLVVDHADAALAPAIEREGVRCLVTDTVMANRTRAASLAAVVRDALR